MHQALKRLGAPGAQTRRGFCGRLGFGASLAHLIKQLRQGLFDVELAERAQHLKPHIPFRVVHKFAERLRQLRLARADFPKHAHSGAAQLAWQARLQQLQEFFAGSVEHAVNQGRGRTLPAYTTACGGQGRARLT